MVMQELFSIKLVLVDADNLVLISNNCGKQTQIERQTIDLLSIVFIIVKEEIYFWRFPLFIV